MSQLTKQEIKTWQELQKRAPPKTKGKPNKDQLQLIREFRAAKKEFLGQYAPDKQTLFTNYGKPTKPKQQTGVVDDATKQLRQLHSLVDFSIPNHRLVDIGANLQSRNSKPAIARMLQRAHAAGVGHVVLTGCSVKGSRQGIDTCHWWNKESNKASTMEVQTGTGEALNKTGGDEASNKADQMLIQTNAQVPNKTDDQKTQHPPQLPHVRGATKVFCTVGVHPHDAKTICDKSGNIRTELIDELRAMASDPFCVSLGECGLDYDRMFSPRDVQIKVFEAQIALARELNRSVFVHLRERDLDKGEPLGAYQDAANVLAKFPEIPPERICVHCFTGGPQELRDLVSRGFSIGVTGFAGMAKRATANGTLDALKRNPDGTPAIPLDRLMIETDAPFMTPDKKWFPRDIGIKGKNEPCVLPGVCRAVAEAMDAAPEQVAEHSTRNASRFFDFAAAESRVAVI